MSDNNKSSKTTDNSIQGNTPGEVLKAARKKQGKSEKNVANALKITTYRLKAMEANDFSDFPSETYVRGYLKNYGRLLNIDELALISVYENSKPEKHGISEQEGSEATLAIANTHKQWWFVYLVLVVLVFLWVLSYWLLGGSNEQEDSSITYPGFNSEIKANNATSEQQLSQQAPVSTEVSTEAPSEELSVEQQVVKPLLVGSPASASADEDTMVVSRLTAAEVVKAAIAKDQPEPQVQAATSLVANGDQLSFSFKNPCWIKVSDVNGEVIFAGLQQPGTDLSLLGKGPFTVVVGNVDGTSLVYNGEPVTLSARGANKLVRLQVGG